MCLGVAILGAVNRIAKPTWGDLKDLGAVTTYYLDTFIIPGLTPLHSSNLLLDSQVIGSQVGTTTIAEPRTIGSIRLHPKRPAAVFTSLFYNHLPPVAIHLEPTMQASYTTFDLRKLLRAASVAAYMLLRRRSSGVVANRKGHALANMPFNAGRRQIVLAVLAARPLAFSHRLRRPGP